MLHFSQVIWESKGESSSNLSPYQLLFICEGEDHQLQVVDRKSKVIWSLGVSGSSWAVNGYAKIQNDGDFVMFDGEERAMWRSNTGMGRAGSGCFHNFDEAPKGICK